LRQNRPKERWILFASDVHQSEHNSDRSKDKRNSEPSLSRRVRFTLGC
jgi:hypothetical protein